MEDGVKKKSFVGNKPCSLNTHQSDEKIGSVTNYLTTYIPMASLQIVSFCYCLLCHGSISKGCLYEQGKVNRING